VKKYLLLFIVTLYPAFLISQSKSDTLKEGEKITYGLSFGPMFPAYFKPIFDPYAHTSLKSFNNKYRGAFLIGCYLNLKSHNPHFLFQPEINYRFVEEHIDYISHYYTHIGDYSDTASFNYSYSDIVLSVLPSFLIVDRKDKISIGLGLYYSTPINSKFKGQIVENGPMRVNDTLSPCGYTFINVRAVKNDNEIKGIFNLNKTIGLFFKLGVEIPCKEKKLTIAFKIYKGSNNFICINHFRQYLMSICINYPITK
jgi:hypothetical protein